jgi:membrane-associated phospholipid phosphatase
MFAQAGLQGNAGVVSTDTHTAGALPTGQVESRPASSPPPLSPFPVLEARPARPAARLGRWLAGHHPVTVYLGMLIACYLVLVPLMSLLGLTLLHVLLPWQGLGHDDEHVNVWLAAHRSGFDNTGSEVVSGIADIYAIPAVVALTTIAAAITRNWRVAGFILAAIALESGSYRLTSMLIERHRPEVHRLDVLPVMASYPSGHVAASVAVFGGLALLITSRWRNRWLVALCWTFAIALPPLVALARMYRGMHHPSDTIAGLVLGLSALVAALLVVRTAGAVAERRKAAA